jgi:response regulator RpfG family c-di-GMP phosphodiesterase
MGRKPRVLTAAQPEAWRLLETMLEDVVDLVPAHTIGDALKILEREPIDLILSTVAFDESRMIEFLQTVKRTASMDRIPFLCTRAISGVLRDSLIASMRDSCIQCGAVDLIDIAKESPAIARDVLRRSVRASLEPGRASR